MNLKSLKTALQIGAPVVAALLLLTTGAVLAQISLPATEGGDQTTSGAPPTDVEQMMYVDGQAPDDKGSANRATAPNLSFSYYMVSGPELQPRSTGYDQIYNANGCAYMNTGTSTNLLTGTGLHIPDGSIIKYIRLYYNDTSASGYVRAFLTRYAPGTDSEDLVSAASTAAYTGGYSFVVSNEITETVNNTAYNYMLYAWPTGTGSTMQFCGIRVAYYAPLYAPIYLPAVRN